MSLVAFFGRAIDAESQKGKQGIREEPLTIPVAAEWKKYGTITGWINLLENYKKDTKFKWRILLHLKSGFKVGIDKKENLPELYKTTFKVSHMLDFSDPCKDQAEVCNQAVQMLVGFLKNLARLVKDFRAFYNPSKFSAKLIDRLAKNNPKIFAIRQAGTDGTGHSVTIEIVNLLTTTNVNIDPDVAMLAVSAQVLKYMLKLSKMVNSIPNNKKKEGENEMPSPMMHSSTRQPSSVNDYVELLSVQSMDLLDLSKNEEEVAKMEYMIKKLVMKRLLP